MEIIEANGGGGERAASADEAGHKYHGVDIKQTRESAAVGGSCSCV